MAQFNNTECARAEQCSVEPDPTVAAETNLGTSCLDQRVEDLVTAIKPEERSEERRNRIFQYVNALIQQCFQPLQVVAFMFGSVPLKTYLPDGDIDLSLFQVKGPSIKPNWTIKLQRALQEEERNPLALFAVRDIQVINAEVNLVKCLVDNTVVDISFETIGGLCTVLFLETIDRKIGSEHLFKRSIILVKAWCYYESRLLGAHHGLISTYALEVLVLYIFNFHHRSLRSPLQVLRKFLEVFSTFDWDRYCLSLHGPVPLSSFPNPKVEFPDKLPYPPLLDVDFLGKLFQLYSIESNGTTVPHRSFQLKFLNIIDPLLHTNNLGRSVSKASFSRVRKAFAHGAQVLKQTFLQQDDAQALAAIDHFFRNTWKAQRSRGVPRYVQPPPPSIRSNWSSTRSTLNTVATGSAPPRETSPELQQLLLLSQKGGLPNQYVQYHNSEQQSAVTSELLRLLAGQFHAPPSASGAFRATVPNPETSPALPRSVSPPSSGPSAQELEAMLLHHRSSAAVKAGDLLPMNGSSTDFHQHHGRPLEARVQSLGVTLDTAARLLGRSDSRNNLAESSHKDNKVVSKVVDSTSSTSVARDDSDKKNSTTVSPGEATTTQEAASTMYGSHLRSESFSERDVVDRPLAPKLEPTSPSAPISPAAVGHSAGVLAFAVRSTVDGPPPPRHQQDASRAVSTSVSQEYTEPSLSSSSAPTAVSNEQSNTTDANLLRRSRSTASIHLPETVRLNHSLSDGSGTSVVTSTGYFQPSSKFSSRSSSAPVSSALTLAGQARKELDAAANVGQIPRSVFFQPLVLPQGVAGAAPCVGSLSAGLSQGARAYGPNTAQSTATLAPNHAVQGVSWGSPSHLISPQAAFQLMLQAEQQPVLQQHHRFNPDLLSGDLSTLALQLQQARVCSDKQPLSPASLHSIAEVATPHNQQRPSHAPSNSPPFAHFAMSNLLGALGDTSPLSAAIAAINQLHQLQGSGIDTRALQRVLAEALAAQGPRHQYENPSRAPMNGPLRGTGVRPTTRMRSPDMFHGRGRHRNNFYGPGPDLRMPSGFPRSQKPLGAAQQVSPDLRLTDQKRGGASGSNDAYPRPLVATDSGPSVLADDPHSSGTTALQPRDGFNMMLPPDQQVNLFPEGAPPLPVHHEAVNFFPEELRLAERVPTAALECDKDSTRSNGARTSPETTGHSALDKASLDSASACEFVLADEDFPALAKPADPKSASNPRRPVKPNKTNKEKAPLDGAEAAER